MKKTNTLCTLAAVASLAAFPAANAQDDVTCENANFSEQVLESFGSIRFSCLEIVDMGGTPHAKLKATVLRVTPPKLTVRLDRNDGSTSNPVTFTPPPDFEFTVDEDRKKVTLRELTPTTKLNVYVPVDAPIGRLGFTVDPATGEVSYFELDED
jgi:hypothetical protein